jgi:hypothetical protein
MRGSRQVAYAGPAEGEEGEEAVEVKPGDVEKARRALQVGTQTQSDKRQAVHERRVQEQRTTPI